MTLALPLSVVLILLVLRYVGDARWYQLGFHRGRLVADAVGGYLGWLILTPLVLTLYCVVAVFLGAEAHPLTRVVEDAPLPLEWGLVVFQGVVAAPVLEELVFRGVLQFWLTRRVMGGHLALAGALVVSVLLSDGRYTESRSFLEAYAPCGFVLLMIGLYVLISWVLKAEPDSWTRGEGILEETPAPGLRTTFQAIYGTALLFAAFHSSVWPSPVPLFLLGLGLGWLAYRTQSLVGPMVVHALFNGVACLTMVLPLWRGMTK
jgi:membrane protease YdiL (CAAX protease family)